MSHSLTNAKKEQFRFRVASFSTHGSKRGYSDLGDEFKDCDFIDLVTSRATLIHNLNISKDNYTKKFFESELSKVNALIKNFNRNNKPECEHRLNKGIAFMNVAREFLDKETYMKIMNECLDRYELRDKKTTLSLKNNQE
jgi:hypothetical protein